MDARKGFGGGGLVGGQSERGAAFSQYGAKIN